MYLKLFNLYDKICETSNILAQVLKERYKIKFQTDFQTNENNFGRVIVKSEL